MGRTKASEGAVFSALCRVVRRERRRLFELGNRVVGAAGPHVGNGEIDAHFERVRRLLQGFFEGRDRAG